MFGKHTKKHWSSTQASVSPRSDGEMSAHPAEPLGLVYDTVAAASANRFRDVAIRSRNGSTLNDRKMPFGRYACAHVTPHVEAAVRELGLRPAKRHVADEELSCGHGTLPPRKSFGYAHSE